MIGPILLAALRLLTYVGDTPQAAPLGLFRCGLRLPRRPIGAAPLMLR